MRRQGGFGGASSDLGVAVKRLIAVVMSGLLVAVAAAPAQAAPSIQTTLSITAPAAATYGSSYVVQGVLSRAGTSTRLPNSLVYLLRAPRGGAWKVITSTRTSTTGFYKFATPLSGIYDYRTYYPGTASYKSTYSAIRRPIVRPKLSIVKLETADENTGLLRATGTIKPSPPNGSGVALQSWDATARAWRTLATTQVNAGAFAVAVKVPGSVRTYRWYTPARNGYGYGVSPSYTYAHYVWRGAFTRPILRQGGHGSITVENSAGRDRAYWPMLSGRYHWIHFNTSGCRGLSTEVTAQGQPGATGRIMWSMTPPGGHGRLIDAAYPGPITALDRWTTADPVIEYYLAMPYTTATLVTTIRLLCAN